MTSQLFYLTLSEGDEEDMSSYQRNIDSLIQENEELKSELRLQKEFAISAGRSGNSLFMIPDKNLLERNKELEFKISEMIAERKSELEELQMMRTTMQELVKKNACTL